MQIQWGTQPSMIILKNKKEIIYSLPKIRSIDEPFEPSILQNWKSVVESKAD